MHNFDNVDNYLEHYGKKGMKWGNRAAQSLGFGGATAKATAKSKAKAESPKGIAKQNRKDVKDLKAQLKSDARYEKYKANKPTAAQLKKNRQRAKVVGGVALLAGTAAAGVVLGRRGRIKISDANKMANAKSSTLVKKVGESLIKNPIDREILGYYVRDIAAGIY